MLPSVQSRPCNSSRIFSLEEEGLGFAILKAEDLAVTTYVEFPLCRLISLEILPGRSNKEPVV